jgi:hypothetical protein
MEPNALGYTYCEPEGVPASAWALACEELQGMLLGPVSLASSQQKET